MAACAIILVAWKLLSFVFVQPDYRASCFCLGSSGTEHLVLVRFSRTSSVTCEYWAPPVTSKPAPRILGLLSLSYLKSMLVGPGGSFSLKISSDYSPWSHRLIPAPIGQASLGNFLPKVFPFPFMYSINNILISLSVLIIHKWILLVTRYDDTNIYQAFAMYQVLF